MNSIASTSKVQLSEVPQARLGMWILIAGELVIFGGLIASYLLFRVRHPSWADMAAHTNVYLGALNTFVLLTSSYFAVMAHKYAVEKNTKKVVTFISGTIACALIFLVVKGMEYYTEITHGFTLPGNDLLAQGETVNVTYWAYYYLLTGLHGVHVIVGAIILFVVMMGAKKGENLHRVEIAGLYWHMVDIVWIFLFPILYIAN